MRKVAVFSLMLLLAAAPAGFAQKKNTKNLVATDPAEAGPDFSAQGEYSGLVAGDFRSRRVGWQVIALGDGKFRAVEYAGGLPADGWDGKTPKEYGGQRDAHAVHFTVRDEYSVLLIAGEVWFRDVADGALVGLLSKARRLSPTLGARPPAGAVVLFDGLSGGTSAEHFLGGRVTEDGLLMEGAITKRRVRDFFLHVEFRTPFMPSARGQGRGNSGLYLQGRYEVQILDSFGLKGEDNECGGLYQEHKPALNMCLPPLSWQTYDIEFRAPPDDDEKRLARLTVRLNGVTIHQDVRTPPTGGGKNITEKHPKWMRIELQNHGDSVRFRNIWMIESNGSAHNSG